MVAIGLFERIVELLDSKSIKYIIIEHAPTVTSVDSARERGELLKIGAKALLVKIEERFLLCVLPADRRLNSSAVKILFNVKSMRFADEEELGQITGCVKGAVPPFGNLFGDQKGVEMVVDRSLFEEEYMAFNAGLSDRSIKMRTEDYKKFMRPRIEAIAQ